jgi:hypothetical protein
LARAEPALLRHRPMFAAARRWRLLATYRPGRLNRQKGGSRMRAGGNGQLRIHHAEAPMMEAGRGGLSRRFIRSRGRPDQSPEQDRRKKKSPHIHLPIAVQDRCLPVSRTRGCRRSGCCPNPGC